jgi:hypothetical protein
VAAFETTMIFCGGLGAIPAGLPQARNSRKHAPHDWVSSSSTAVRMLEVQKNGTGHLASGLREAGMTQNSPRFLPGPR